LKINVNTGFFATDGSVDAVVGVNTGEGSSLGNKEVVRLTKVQNLDIGEISGTVACTRALIIADVTGLTVGHIYGENVKARLLQCDEDQDASDGNISGVYIGGYHASMDAAARSVFGLKYGSLGVRTIGDVVIESGFATGYSNFLAETTDTTLGGPIYIRGIVGSSDPNPAVENPVDSVQLVLDVSRDSKRYVGKAVDFDFSAFTSFRADAFDPAGSPSSKGGVFLTSRGAAAGVGNFGGGFSFSRPGSTRRGAAIASKQITSDGKQVGLSFFVGNPGTSATEQVAEKMTLKHGGVLNLSSLPTYADDTAAGAGGLVQGDMYITATGEIRMKL
jgi:hypothetical protein